jgi:hypothetical protein
MLKNKTILFMAILILLSSACSDELSFEGKIRNIDTEISNGMKSVISITLTDEKGNEKKFDVNPEKKLENINLEFTYSHIKLHMEEGEKVKIKYYILDSKNKITNFMFMGHSH